MPLPGSRVSTPPDLGGFCPTLPDPVATPSVRQLVGGACNTGQSGVASSLCHLGWRPILLTGFFRHLLIHHFGTPDNVEETTLRGLTWDEDAGRTKILIESVHRWSPDSAGVRPAVLIKRNTMQSQQIAIGDRGATRTEDGAVQYSTMWVGSHTLWCITGTGGGAEVLGSEVQRQITQFAPVLRDSIRLHKLGVIQVEEVGIVEEAQQSYVVPVVVGWAYEESWFIRKDALPLQKMAMDLVIQRSIEDPTMDCLA